MSQPADLYAGVRRLAESVDAEMERRRTMNSTVWTVVGVLVAVVLVLEIASRA